MSLSFPKLLLYHIDVSLLQLILVLVDVPKLSIMGVTLNPHIYICTITFPKLNHKSFHQLSLHKFEMELKKLNYIMYALINLNVVKRSLSNPNTI